MADEIPHDKLTSNLTVRLEPELLDSFKLLCLANGEEHPEVIREFVSSYIAREKKRFEVLNKIFG